MYFMLFGNNLHLWSLLWKIVALIVVTAFNGLNSTLYDILQNRISMLHGTYSIATRHCQTQTPLFVFSMQLHGLWYIGELQLHSVSYTREFIVKLLKTGWTFCGVWYTAESTFCGVYDTPLSQHSAVCMIHCRVNILLCVLYTAEVTFL